MIITVKNNYKQLEEWLSRNKKVLLVCGESIRYYKELNRMLNSIKVQIIKFTDFMPNPQYESVIKGVNVYRSQGCDSIMAVGGGSAIDVAKCIKLYNNMEGDGTQGEFLYKEIIPNSVPFLALPTTAGTGSEATCYAVIYYGGTKQSITSVSCMPDTVLLDSNTLKTLPLYQKKVTMMDAFCHAIESFWSVNSTKESQGYSKAAIIGIMENMDGYLANTESGNENMLIAAHNAGKAINITQTTAGHAMCYKITTLFGCAHGHAAILCNRILFPWMIMNTDKCIDPRGEKYLKVTLRKISEAMGCRSPGYAAEMLLSIFTKLELAVPKATKEQYEELKKSVAIERLKNHPVAMDVNTINELYHKILR